METHKETFIIVNTQKKDWDREKITYEEVVKLAFLTDHKDENVIYTVDYSRGPDGHQDGSLVKGQSVTVKNGMIFNVTKTSKS